jgi:hypothetical protein
MQNVRPSIHTLEWIAQLQPLPKPLEQIYGEPS